MDGRWWSKRGETFYLDIKENMVSGSYQIYYAGCHVNLPLQGIVIDKGHEIEVALSITVYSQRSREASQSVAFSGTLRQAGRSDLQYLHTSELANNFEILHQGMLVLETAEETADPLCSATIDNSLFLDFVIHNYEWPPCLN